MNLPSPKFLQNVLRSFYPENRQDAVKKNDASDRRDYGHGVRLWNDRDPRADQSFFLGGVPGFVLSSDQKVIDWNIAFDLIFSSSEGVVRGMAIGEWYKLIDNFRRLPNREAKLFGEAVLPITDRERVVFVSPTYGRMVFMKIMSPVLDRISGRIIGWNVTLNVNSVTERVKFFEDLYARIDGHSRHARYIAGAEQLLARSSSHQEFVDKIVEEVGGADRVLVLGAVKSESLVEALLSDGLHRQVTVVDDDAEALRLVKARCGRFHGRLRLVRRGLTSLKSLPANRYQTAVVMYPRLSEQDLAFMLDRVLMVMPPQGRVVVAGYTRQANMDVWWKQLRMELESAGEMDALRWHLGIVVDEDRAHYESTATVPSRFEFNEVWPVIAGARLLSSASGFLAGQAAVAVVRRSSAAAKAI